MSTTIPHSSVRAGSIAHHQRFRRVGILSLMMIGVVSGLLAACGETSTTPPPVTDTSCKAGQSADAPYSTENMEVHAWTLHCYQGRSITASLATLYNVLPQDTKASDVQATINWGDSNTVVTTTGQTKCAGQSPGEYVICGTHAYAQVGVFKIVVTISLLDSNSFAAKTTVHSTAVILAAPCHAAYLQWDVPCDISDAEGLVVTNVSLGSRYMAQRMGIGYIQLKTAFSDGVRYIHLGPDTDEFNPDGTPAGHSTLIRLPTITELASAGPGDPGALAITADYRVDLAWPATSASSWLEVIQQYAFYGVIDESATQNPSDSNSPFLYVACEPALVAQVPLADHLRGCGRWKPLVAYIYHQGTTDTGYPDTLESISIAERWDFHPDGKTVPATTFIHDCNDSEHIGPFTGQFCIRTLPNNPGVAPYSGWSDGDGDNSGFLDGDHDGDGGQTPPIAAATAFPIQNATIIRAVEMTGATGSGWHNQPGDFDNLHLTREAGVGLPYPIPPGCEECVHIHWRWGSDIAPGSDAFGHGHPLIGCQPHLNSWNGQTPPDDGSVLCEAAPSADWSKRSNQSIDVALVAAPDLTANDVRALIPGCCTPPDPSLDNSTDYGSGTASITQTSPVVWYVVTTKPTSDNPETTDVLFAGGGFFDCDARKGCSAGGGSQSATPTPTTGTAGTPSMLSLDSAGSPLDITTGPDGAVWFTEYANQIGRVTPSGTLTQFPFPSPYNTGPLPNPITDPERYLTTGPDNNLWVTLGETPLDGTTTTPAAIGRLTPGGKWNFYPLPASAACPDDPNSSPGMGFGPITAGPAQSVWFIVIRTPFDVNCPTDEIGRISTVDGHITLFPLPNPFASISDITAGPDGNIWFGGISEDEFAGPYTQRIWRITRDGIVSSFPLPPSLAPVGENPASLTTGPDHNLWFTEPTVGIVRLTPDGHFTSYANKWIPAVARGITAGPDGNLWFVELGNKIGQITVQGTITEYPLDVGTQPATIISGPDGYLWFMEAWQDKGPYTLGRISVSGNALGQNAGLPNVLGQNAGSPNTLEQNAGSPSLALEWCG